jgi:hypothetical protein
MWEQTVEQPPLHQCPYGIGHLEHTFWTFFNQFIMPCIASKQKLTPKEWTVSLVSFPPDKVPRIADDEA